MVNHKQHHRLLVLLIILVLLIPILAGCTGNRGQPVGEQPAEGQAQSPQPGDEQAQSPQPEEKVLTGEEASPDATEVTFWTTHGGHDLDALKIIVENFNEENPEISVKLNQIPPEQTADVTKLMTAVRGGTGPDIYFFNRPFASQRAADGLLQDLTPFMKSEDLSEQYLEFAWNEVIFDGKPYALPFDTDARALYYRKDVLREAGVDPNELDPKNGPITLDRLREIAMQVNETDARGNYSRIGFIPWFDQGWHYTWGYVFGGRFFDTESCKVTPTNEGVVQGLQFMYDWAKEMDPKKVQVFLSSYNRPDAPPQQHPFITGRIAMMVGGDWFISSMRNYAPDADYGITYIPIPKQGDKPTTWSAGWSVVIPQGAKEPEAAFKFMRYMAGEPGQRIYTKETQHFPTWKSLLEDESLYDERHKFFNELLPDSSSLPPTPVGALYWDELTSAQESVYLNQATPQQALQQVEQHVQPRLEEYCSRLQQ